MELTPYPWLDSARQLAVAAVERGAHALMLHGPRGCGKRELALRLAAAHLCESPGPAGSPCGTCASCRWLAAGSHPDFLLLEPPLGDDGAEKPRGREAAARVRPIGIDQIRAIPDVIGLAPHRYGGGKAVVLSPAEALNAPAANALLKSLEEPPAGTLFILVSHRPGLLLPTVRSRCLAVAIESPAPDVAANWLARQGLDDPTLRLAWCGRAPLDALTASDDPYWLRRRELAESLLSADTDAVALADRIRDLPPPGLLDWLAKWSFDLVLVAAGGAPRYCPDFAPQLRALAGRMRPLSMIRYHRQLLRWRRTAHHPLNPRLFLEQMLLQYYSALREGLTPRSVPR